MDHEADAFCWSLSLSLHADAGVRVELVRFYLYDWGFVCSSFYADGASQPASPDLLLALSWLLAFAKFFERLHEPILEVGSSTGCAETLIESTHSVRS